MDLAVVIFSGLAALATVTLAVLAFFQTRAGRKAAEAPQTAVEASQRMAQENQRMVDINRATLEQNREMVEINRSTLEEIRTEREARERPRVIVYVDYDHLPMLYLVICNVGGSAAARVAFSFSPGLIRPKMEHSREEEEVNLADELNILRGGYGIKLLPAGAKISLWWGHAEDIAQQFRYQPTASQRVEVEVHYYSLTKERYPKLADDYREDFILDPVDVWQANQTAVRLRPSLNELVRPVIRVAEKIARVIDGPGYFKVKTPADVKREREEQRQELIELSEEHRKKAEAGGEERV